MNTSQKKLLIILFIPFSLLFFGCHSTFRDNIRLEETEQFRSSLQKRTEQYREEYSEHLTLNDCWEITRQESLNIRAQELNQEISRLQRHIAFANFLPVVELELDYTAWNKQPAADISDLGPLIPFDYLPLHDKRIRNTTINAHVPIFVPKTWFLYSVRRRGEEIESLLHELTEQIVYLQVVSQYYHCLSVERSINVLESQLKAAEVLHGEAISWFEEEIILPWELMEAGILVQEKQRALHQAQRRLDEAHSELWITLGLSPDAGFKLAEAEFDSPSPAEPEELIMEALLNNPRMHISDREVAIQEDMVKIAITNFLPEIFGFASYQNTSNELARYSSNYLWGAAGVLSVFNGFANVNQYRAARREAEISYLEREEAALALMLQVIKAYNRLRDSIESYEISQNSFAMHDSRLNTIEAEFSEGMITLSELLQARASWDRAKMMVLNTQYQVQVSQSMLEYLIGKPVKNQIDRGE